MAYPTVQTIIQEALTMCAQVSGTSVQTYTEPFALIGVNRMFEQIFMKRKWEHLWTWEQKTLDGTTGLVTTAFSDVVSWVDIDEMRPGGQSDTITQSVANEHTVVTGSLPLYYTVLPWDHADADTKFVKFWPITATGTVDFHIAHRPAAFAVDDDIVPMDKTLMVTGLTWWMLADDGLNPASADKAQVVFDNYYQDLVARLGAKPIGHGRSNRDSRLVYIQ